MSAPSDNSRLCRLIHDSLSLYNLASLTSLNAETEKSLLIRLSHVYTTIRQWIQESDYDSDAENETLAKTVHTAEGSLWSQSHSDDSHSLADVIGDLMPLLTVENPYIQHLIGNTLVAIFEFLASSESGWDELMRSMCLCLKLASDNALLSYLEPMKMNSELKFDSSDAVMLLKLRLKSANLSTASAIVRVLRNVLKLLNHDFSKPRLKVYQDSVCTVISDSMCDILNRIRIGHHGESVIGSSRGVLVCPSSAHRKMLTIFQANLLQLLCSLVDNNSLMESEIGSVNNQRAISTISSLIPKLLAWCLGEPQNSDDVDIFHYFRHKILMLLTRISSQMHLECSVLCTWLDLIREYFQYLLSRPIISPGSEQQECLEGSPFWSHSFDAKRRALSPYHLQRQAVFLFLRCGFSLISMKEKSCKHCASADPNSSLAVDLNTDPKCWRRGLLELQRWLQWQLPAFKFEENQIYSERCVDFSISFLQLYMHEDDILFDMLLQLFHLPVHSDRCAVEVEPSLVSDSNTFGLISDIFNPIHMFHFFLSEIRYDHQVLLDYLISRDSGACSAEYLLRSLRLICDSWDLFVEFPDTAKAVSQSDQKRRKVSENRFNLRGLSSTTSTIHDETPLAELVCTKGQASISPQGITKRLSFASAKECLFSLQSSVESLNQKGLYPYNPQVLLRRLRRFQELCQLAV